MNQTDVMKIMTNSRKFNVMRIIHYLRANENASIADLANGTHIPAQTVYRIIRSLHETGIISKTARSESASGRKAVLYSINPWCRLLLGVYMDKTVMNVFLSDLSGTILNTHSYVYGERNTKQEILDLLDTGIQKALSQLDYKGNAMDKVAVIGFAVTANVDPYEGVIVGFNNLNCLNGFKLVQYMKKTYGKNTVLLKNSYLESFSSLIRLKEQDIDNFVEVHIGVGVGAAIVIDGLHYRGAFGNAGELVNVCNDAGKSVELLYNTSVLYRAFTEYVRSSGDAGLQARVDHQLELLPNSPERALMKVIDEEVAAKNQSVFKLLNELIPGWVQIIYNLVIYYDPQAVIVSGDISDESPHVFELIKKGIMKRIKTKTRIIPSSMYDSPELSIIPNIIDNAFQDILDTLQ